MKKLIFLIIALLALLSFASCEEYKPAIDPPDTPDENGGEGGNEEENDPSDDFTVTLMRDGKTYRPDEDENIEVYWSDGFSIHSAAVDSKGTARIDGLDGDYRVTLSSVPEDYAYDPNVYTATNDNRNIIVDLYKLDRITGKGTGLYDCFNFSKTGVYSATIKSPEDAVYFEFSPRGSGTYTVESWVDTVADDVNPKIVKYLGSGQFKYGPTDIDDGGPTGSYTRNFVHKIEIADEMISTSGGGQQVFTFALKAESKTASYPITVSFAVKLNGGFELDHAAKYDVVPKADLSHFDFDAFNALAGTKKATPEKLIPGTASAYIFDEDDFRLWKIEEGGDGVYHVYDEEKYAETGGYGPVLFAYITTKCRFVDLPFTQIEYVGNKALTVNGVSNYKHFIEGYSALSTLDQTDLGSFNGGSYYCVKGCPCHPGKGPGDTGFACPPGCDTCLPDCRPCLEELIGHPGYAGYSNADGVAPVTEELKVFLQLFSESQRYFADGEGWVENNGFMNIDALEDSQWLFACGYYVEG